jgi:clan AA aspartic protease
MGWINVKLTLANPKRTDIQPIEADALVDTGSVFLAIPEHVKLQLQLEVQSDKDVTLADDTHRLIPYVGPIETRFKNRVAYVGAIVMGDEVLLGAIPMEDLDLVLLPQQGLADVNPASPNIAAGRAKQSSKAIPRVLLRIECRRRSSAMEG